MKTKAVRIYGKKDLRLEEFELPALKDDEILAHVVSDSICMSSYKAAVAGDRSTSGSPRTSTETRSSSATSSAASWSRSARSGDSKFQAGQKFSIQPALNYENGPVGVLAAPGYSYRYIGGDATYVIIPDEVMEQDCLLDYEGDAYFKGSLAEPMSCIVGRLPRELPHQARQLRAPDGHRRGRLDGAPGGRGSHGPRRHRLRPPLRPPPRAAGRHRHRRCAPGTRRVDLHRRSMPRSKGVTLIVREHRRAWRSRRLSWWP